MRSVKLFKKLKNNVYNWGQIVSMVSNLLFLINLFFLLVSLTQMILKTQPFYISVSSFIRPPDITTDQQTTDYFS